MTKIEWTDLTWSPTTGCTKISAGCQNCYAEKMHKRLRRMGQYKYQNEFNCIMVHPKELNRDFGKKPKKIFVNSMSDLFHDDVPGWFISDVLDTIRENTNHIFQILTKRPLNAYKFQEWDQHFTWPDNLWLGVTVENKKELHRIETLRRIKSVIKFISFEPLLEDVGLVDLTDIDWVIAGAETGQGARKMSLDWAMGISTLTAVLNIPFFFKKPSKGDFINHIPCLNVREFPPEK